MLFCPYCGVRQNIDLRQLNFRDISPETPMPCPACHTPMGALEFDAETPVRIEHCAACHGLFFNPGELELLLDTQTPDLIWLDNQQLSELASSFQNSGTAVYRKCPACAERMSPHNFGGGSGVILDRCGTHGYWLDGGELRKLAEWWRAGGKLIFQQSETTRAKWLHERKKEPESTPRAPIDNDPDMEPLGPLSTTTVILATLAELILG